MKAISLVLVFVFASNALANQKVRHIQVKKDAIVKVKTSLGIATIIEVPDRPNSVVVGDQDAFKVEYLDQAITIKPVVPGAKSNLYVYTDWARYNVELVTGPELISDYVVYLEHEKKEANSPKSRPDVTWTKFTNTLKNKNLRIDVKQVGRTVSGVLLVEFKISSTTKETIKPEWLWMTQEGRTIPIHNLFVSRLDVAKDYPAHGTIQLLSQDLEKELPIRMELRRDKISYLTIKKVNLWK